MYVVPLAKVDLGVASPARVKVNGQPYGMMAKHMDGAKEVVRDYNKHQEA